jgi:hypothetical protein
MVVVRVAISVAMLFALASASVAKQSKCDIVLKRIHSLLDLYDKEHPLKHYPSTLQEFQNFAAKKGQPFDLGVFSKFSYNRHGTSLDLSYTCKDTGRIQAEALRSFIVY